MSIRNVLRNHALKVRQRKFRKLGYNRQDITILSSNCWGGQLYHDAEMRFLSPTINLTFDPLDFLTFVKRVKDIKSTTLIKEKTDKSYPVGLLKYSDGKFIKIHFVHYNSFEDAKEKFYKRASRMVEQKVVLLMVNELSKQIIDNFNSISYKKICIYGSTIEDVSNNTNYIQFKKIKSSKRDILSFKSYLTGKRLIDDIDFDYYSFLFNA